MRYQLSQHGWPIGDRLIPVGTVIEIGVGGAAGDDWSRLAAFRVPPINSVPLDQEAYQAMRAAGYPDDRIPRVGDEVKRA
jgi:hypothetical protein